MLCLVAHARDMPPVTCYRVKVDDGMQLNAAQYNTDTKGCALPWLDPHAHPTPSPPSPPKPSPPPPYHVPLVQHPATAPAPAPARALG